MDEITKLRKHYRELSARIEGLKKAKEVSLERIDSAQRIIKHADKMLPQLDEWRKGTYAKLVTLGTCERQKKLQKILELRAQLVSMGIEVPESTDAGIRMLEAQPKTLGVE